MRSRTDVATGAAAEHGRRSTTRPLCSSPVDLAAGSADHRARPRAPEPALSGLPPDLLRRLLRARDRMDAASHEDWPVPRLAAISGVSPAHFARSFKQAFGLPPHRYLLTRRIERATALLRGSDRSITDIALETGWRSLGSFSRTYRAVTGESPSECRARSTSDDPLPASIPECIIRAVLRPELKTAVLEKQRQEAAATVAVARAGSPAEAQPKPPSKEQP